MRWSLWLVLVGLLVASATRTPPVATAVATGLFTAGYGARHRYRARLVHHHERRRLRAIERQLEAEDPDFVRRLRAAAGPGRRATGPLTAAVAFGLVVTGIGLLGDPALAAVGVLITTTASFARLRSRPGQRGSR